MKGDRQAYVFTCSQKLSPRNFHTSDCHQGPSKNVSKSKSQCTSYVQIEKTTSGQLKIGTSRVFSNFHVLFCRIFNSAAFSQLLCLIL